MNLKETGQANGEEMLTILEFTKISWLWLHIIYFTIYLIEHYYDKISQQQNEPQKIRKINDQCSICLEDIQNEVQLICSHSYCAKCIICYLKQTYKASRVRCPLCRSDSKLLFANFERTESSLEQFDFILSFNQLKKIDSSSSCCFC